MWPAFHSLIVSVVLIQRLKNVEDGAIEDEVPVTPADDRDIDDDLRNSSSCLTVGFVM